MALIPLALVLGEVTEDLATRFGDVIGGLLNATFGNVVELILSIAALTRGLYTVVAMSLIGSILSNLLLVMGEGLPQMPQSQCAQYSRLCVRLCFVLSLSTITSAMHFKSSVMACRLLLPLRRHEVPHTKLQPHGQQGLLLPLDDCQRGHSHPHISQVILWTESSGS